MSFDVWLEIDTGGDSPARVSDTLNPTYNLSPMFREALGFSLRKLAGQRAFKTIEPLEAAVKAMEDRPEHYKQFNPPNGWGDYEGALDTLRTMLNDARRHPIARWHV